MENNTEIQKTIDQVYTHAAELLIHQNKTSSEAIDELIAIGLDTETATIVVNKVEEHIKEENRKRARRDMIFGALWCVGGIIATVADIGYIFWGAIVFGAIQFIRGASKYE